MRDTTFFRQAEPVWLSGREREMNLTAGFSAAFRLRDDMDPDCVLAVAASTLYRVYVNGRFAGYGPARGPHDYYRVDQWPLGQYLRTGHNSLYIEVAGYNVNSYYTIDQPSFLQAEVTCADQVLAATAPQGGFAARVVTQRKRKVQRFSFQRPFAEAWEIDPAYYEPYTGGVTAGEPLERQADKVLLPRHVPLPRFDRLPARYQIDRGTVRRREGERAYRRHYSLTDISDKLRGFRPEELEVHLTDEVQDYLYVSEGRKRLALLDDQPVRLPANSYVTLSLGTNSTGFLKLDVVCPAPMRLYLLFDEILSDADVDALRLDCANIVRYDLAAGEYSLQTFECYTLKYLKIVCLGGDCVISSVGMVDYSAPLEHVQQLHTGNAKLRKIYNAALNTYKQNAVDLYTDCPSRERAGWLCDSFFTGRVEYALTGRSVVEHNFLENYALPASFRNIPEGMVPMCYPADHNDKNFLPNWSWWLILELREYRDRSGDQELIACFKPKIYGLIDYFRPFLNEDGLLENLQGWVFVEWSKANELTEGVNYPSNMTYAAALQAAGELYDDEALLRQAEAIRRVVRAQSYNGTFFVDNAVRVDGTLTPSGSCTEVCQYYAFYFDVATPETYPQLWQTLVRDFGPQRKLTNKHPDIYFANAFIGNYLRLDLLFRYGYRQEAMENIEDYFFNMAETTGTLWEMDSSVASLNHGFASHVIYWLLQDQVMEQELSSTILATDSPNERELGVV